MYLSLWPYVNFPCVTFHKFKSGYKGLILRPSEHPPVRGGKCQNEFLSLQPIFPLNILTFFPLKVDAQKVKMRSDFS